MASLWAHQLASREPLPLPSPDALRAALEHIESGNCSMITCPFASEIVALLRVCARTLNVTKTSQETTEAKPT